MRLYTGGLWWKVRPTLSSIISGSIHDGDKPICSAERGCHCDVIAMVSLDYDIFEKGIAVPPFVYIGDNTFSVFLALYSWKNMYLNIAICIHEHFTYHKYTVGRIKSWYRSVTIATQFLWPAVVLTLFEKWCLTAALDDSLLLHFKVTPQ